MKKYVLMAALAFLATTLMYAQVSTTPETPRNYKPRAKELLPMPDSLSIEKIFPVLGKYDVTDKDGETTSVYITHDDKNRGVIWINGLAQGKFKADLKSSPAVYRIPAQKTLLNDENPEETVSDNAAAENGDDTAQKTAKKLSGKSIEEGTLIYDKDANTLQINLGEKFNEADPASVFLTSTEDNADADGASKTKKKNKIAKSINYNGTKILNATSPSGVQ